MCESHEKKTWKFIWEVADLIWEIKIKMGMRMSFCSSSRKGESLLVDPVKHYENAVKQYVNNRMDQFFPVADIIVANIPRIDTCIDNPFETFIASHRNGTNKGNDFST